MHRRPPANPPAPQQQPTPPALTAHEIAPVDFLNPKKLPTPYVDVIIKRDVYFRRTNKLEKEMADAKREKAKIKKDLAHRLIIELQRYSLKTLVLLVGLSLFLLEQHRVYFLIGSVMLLIAVQIGFLMQDLMELKRYHCCN